MMNPHVLKLDKKFSPEEIEELRKLTEDFVGVVEPVEAIIKHLKVKKGIPTVIEYQGRRYVLDDRNNRK